MAGLHGLFVSEWMVPRAALGELQGTCPFPLPQALGPVSCSRLLTSALLPLLFN